MSSTASLNKIAEITIGFWLAGDFLAQTLGLGDVVGFYVTLALLALLLVLQIRRDSYHPALFWAAIVGTTTAGTEISDMMDRTFGFGYVLGSGLLFAGLMVTLVVWYARGRTLSVDPIVEKDSEVLFWIAVLFSNSLGTAFGDALIDPIGLTFAQGAIVCAGVIAVVVLIHYLTIIDAAVLFWAAFIFTRPFGATFGNVLTKEHARGGLELGTLETSLVAAGLLIVVVLVSTRFGKGRQALPRGA